MADPTIPSFLIDSENSSINIVIPDTQAQLKDQGYTYNQAGFSYNEPGVFYGGVYNTNQDIMPIFSNDTASFIIPSISDIVDTGATFGGRPFSIGPGFFLFITQ